MEKPGCKFLRPQIALDKSLRQFLSEGEKHFFIPGKQSKCPKIGLVSSSFNAHLENMFWLHSSNELMLKV